MKTSPDWTINEVLTDDKQLRLYEKWVTNKPSYYPLSDELVLAVPANHQQFWKQKNRVVRDRSQLAGMKRGGIVGFEFFMPDFGGYNPTNFRDEEHEERVRVVYVEHRGMGHAKPGGPANTAHGMLAKYTTSSHSQDRRGFEDRYGLRFYPDPTPTDANAQHCCGIRDAGTGELILMWVAGPPQGAQGSGQWMQATYFSARFGGIEITWRAHMKFLAEWKTIDSQIWRFLEAWNIAEPKAAAEPEELFVGNAFGRWRR